MVSKQFFIIGKFCLICDTHILRYGNSYFWFFGFFFRGGHVEDGPGEAVLPKMLVSDVVVYSPRAIHTVVNNGFVPIKHGQTFSVYNDICRRIFDIVKILTNVTMEQQEITKIAMYRVTYFWRSDWLGAVIRSTSYIVVEFYLYNPFVTFIIWV